MEPRIQSSSLPSVCVWMWKGETCEQMIFHFLSRCSYTSFFVSLKINNQKTSNEWAVGHLSGENKKRVSFMWLNKEVKDFLFRMVCVFDVVSSSCPKRDTWGGERHLSVHLLFICDSHTHRPDMPDRGSSCVGFVVSLLDVSFRSVDCRIRSKSGRFCCKHSRGPGNGWEIDFCQEKSVSQDETLSHLCHFFRVPHGLLVSICFTSVTLLSVQLKGNYSINVDQIEPECYTAFHGCPSVSTDIATEANFCWIDKRYQWITA